METVQINYDSLVKSYYENLNANLRHFRGGPGFLETWVHDENHLRSILGIIDLALASNIHSLEIILSQEVWNEISFASLMQASQSLGFIEKSGNSLIFHRRINEMQKDQWAAIPVAYRKALSSRKIKFALPAHANISVLKSATVDGQKIFLLLEKQTILSAYHQSSGVYSPVLDFLVDCITNKPLQEAIEHGVIYLENSIRDPQEPPPVKGIIMPSNAGDFFSLPLALMRAFTGLINKDRNTWRPNIPPSWVTTSIEEKISKANTFCKQALENLHLTNPNCVVVEIKNHTRFVIRYNPSSENWNFHILSLEKELRRLFGFEVELLLEDLSDRNRREERTLRIDA